MTTIFLANFGFNGDEDGMREDAADWETGASPAAVSIAFDKTTEWLESLKASVENEYLDAYTDMLKEQFEKERVWVELGFGKNGMHDAWMYAINLGGERIALLVVEQRELWDTEH